jgi:hypothetical protein
MKVANDKRSQMSPGISDANMAVYRKFVTIFLLSQLSQTKEQSSVIKRQLL